MVGYPFKINLRALFIKTLIILILSLGVLALLSGIFNLLFSNYIFQKFILPLANIFSQIGYIRQASTIDLIYREWLDITIYIPLVGFMMVIFGLIWHKLENEIKEKGLPRNFSIDKNQPRINPFYIIAIISITIIGAILRAINLNQSFWLDEITTVINFIKPFRLWRYLELGDHYLYSFLGFLSVKLFGETEVTVRLPAFIIGVMTIPVIYYVAKHLLSEKEGLLASGLICVSAFHISYSNQARGYSALALFTLLSSWLFFRVLFNKYPAKRRKENFLFGIFTTLGCLSHFYYIWVLFAQSLTILSLFVVERMIRKKVILLKGYLSSDLLTTMVVGSLTAFIIYGPALIPAVIKKYLTYKGVGGIIFFRILGQLFTGTATNAWGIFFTTLILFSLVDLWKRQNKVLVLYFIFLVGLPLVIIRIICKRAGTNYFIYTLPFLLMLLVHSMFILARRFSVYLRTIILSILIVIFIIVQLPAITHYYRHYKSGWEDYRSVGQLIDKLAKEEDSIYVIAIGQNETQYYIKKHKIKPFNAQEFFSQIDSGKSNIWLIVTYPGYINAYPDPEALKIYEFAKRRLKLFAYFPGSFSDLIVYVKPVRKDGSH